MRNVILCVLILALLAGCSGDFFRLRDEQGNPIPPPEVSAAPEYTPAPTPRVPRSSLFGLAWTPTETVQPLRDASRYNRDVYRLTHQPLFTASPEYLPELVLCEGFRTEDNLTYTLTLRAGVSFHDGRGFTAADAAYTLQQAKGADSPYASRLALLQSAVASDERTLVLTLTEPHARFPMLLDIPVVPDGSAGEELAVGTGPFQFLREETDGRLYLRRAATWKGAQAPVPRVELTAVTAPEDIIDGFEVGAVSLVAEYPFDSTAVNVHTTADTWSYASSRLHYLGFNTLREPYGRPEFRRALSQAADRETLVSEIFEGCADPAVVPLPPGSLPGDPWSRSYGYDPRVTTRLLDQLGFADDDQDGVLQYGEERLPFSAELVVSAENVAACDAAARLAEMLTEQGLPVRCVRLPYEDFLEALETGSFDLYYGTAQLSADLDPGVFLEGGPLWYGGGQYDELEQARTELQSVPEVSLEARRPFYFDFLNQTVIAPLYFLRKQLSAPRGMLKTPTPADTNPFYRWETWGLTLS